MDLSATLAERGKRYGSFAEHAAITQALKDAACNAPHRAQRLAPDQAEALDMIFHKIGRILAGDPNYADSWHDIAGYAKLVEDRLEAEEANRKAIEASGPLPAFG
jgi:hypothetical protein